MLSIDELMPTRGEDEVLDTIVRRSRTLRRRRLALTTTPLVAVVMLIGASLMMSRTTPQTVDMLPADQESAVEEASEDADAARNARAVPGPRAEATPDSLPIAVPGVLPRRPPTTDPKSPPLSRDPVVFVSRRSGLGQIWTMDADGSNATLVVTHDRSWGPVLSPDRTMVAYSAPVPGDPDPQALAGLYVVPRSGGTPRLVWQTPDNSVVVNDWSADGTTLLFTNTELAVGGGTNEWRWGSNGASLRTIRLDGSGQRVEIDESSDGRFTPDGSRIIYHAFAGGIWSAATDGSDARRLTKGGINPAVAPDGRIAYTGNESIYIVDADGSNERKVTWAKGMLFAPSWSTDGRALVATGYHQEEQGYVILAMRTDGTDPRVISAAAGDWGARFPSFGRP